MEHKDIYVTLRQAIGGLSGMSEEQVQPNGANLEDVRIPAVIWAQKEQTAEADLSGAVHHYTTVFQADLLAAEVDDCVDLAERLGYALRCMEDEPDGNGNWVFETALEQKLTFFAENLNCMALRTEITLLWCPLEEEEP